MDGEEKKAYTYMVRCRDGSIYTGWTTTLEKRIAEHNRGMGAKYTRSRRPVELIHYEVFRSRQEAMRREAEIKKLSRKEKIELAQKSN